MCLGRYLNMFGWGSSELFIGADILMILLGACPISEKVVKYTQIVCQNVEEVLLVMLVHFYPKILRSL